MVYVQNAGIKGKSTSLKTLWKPLNKERVTHRSVLTFHSQLLTLLPLKHSHLPLSVPLYLSLVSCFITPSHSFQRSTERLAKFSKQFTKHIKFQLNLLSVTVSKFFFQDLLLTVPVIGGEGVKRRGIHTTNFVKNLSETTINYLFLQYTIFNT